MSDEQNNQRQLAAEVAADRQTNIELLAQQRLVNAEHEIRLHIAHMTAPAELSGLIKKISESMQALGVVHDSCSIQIVNEKGTSFNSFDASKNMDLRAAMDLLQGRNDGEIDHAEWHPWVLEAWRTGQLHYQPCTAATPHLPPAMSILDVPFAHGTLAINRRVPNAFSARDIALVARFAKLLSESLHRFITLVEQAYFEVKKQILQEVRNEIWRMENESGLGQVLEAVRAGLEKLDIPFDACGVNRVDDERDPPLIHSYNLQSTGEPIEIAVVWSVDLILRVWRDQQVCYRRDLASEDAYREKASFDAGFPYGVRSVLDVPFSRGTLAINSRSANAFSVYDIETLEEVAEVLSEAFQRQEDLRQLEARNDALEQQLILQRVDSIVRQRIAAMKEPEDMAEVTQEIGVQLGALGVDYDSCSIQIINENESAFISRSISKAKDWSVASYRALDWGYNENIPRYPWVLETWKTGQLHYDPCTEPASNMPVGLSVVDAPFARGTLSVNKRGANAFSAADLSVLQHVADLLSEAFQSFVYLVEQRENASLQLVLHQVQESVWTMQSEDDLPQVLDVMRQGLDKLQVPFDGCGVNLVDATVDPPAVYSYNLQARGEWSETGAKKGQAVILDIWRAGEVVYRRDLLAEDPRGEQQYIESVLPMQVRSVLDVPFSRGTLAINSVQPNAFTAQTVHTMRAMVAIVESGLRRCEDLTRIAVYYRDLEEKNRLLSAFYEFSEPALVTEGLERVLDLLAQHIMNAGVFRSLMVALVEEDRVRVVRSLARAGMDQGGAPITTEENRQLIGITYDLDNKDILAEVARTGRVEVVEGWDDRYTRRSAKPAHHEGQVAYFVPIKNQGQMVAVLATGSEIAEKTDTLRRIELMQPLLNHVASILGHVRVFEENRERATLLESLFSLSRVALDSLDRGKILDIIIQQVLETRIFRSLMIALVDEQEQQVEVVHSLAYRLPDGTWRDHPEVITQAIGLCYDLHDENITALTARLGEMQIVEEWDERLDSRIDSRIHREGQVSYFIPIRQRERVLAVLATGSTIGEKQATLKLIEQMQPLFDMLAIGLEHARLYQDSLAQARQMEEALQRLSTTYDELGRREQEFRTLADNIPDVTIRIDHQYRVLYVNPAAEQMTGISREHFIGKTGIEIGLPRDLVLRWRRVLAEVFSSGVEQGLNFEMATPKGERYLQARFVLEADGLTVLVVIRDVTESRRLEQEFVRMERVSALGELAAGVSHNLNNVLTGILAPAQLIVRMTADEQVLREADTIIKSAKRARDLVERLNRSVRSSEGSLESVGVESLVREAIEGTRSRWKDEAEARGIAYEIEVVAPGVPPVRGTATGLYEMLTNLIINAVEAMPEGGGIKVSTAADEREVRIEVEDTGSGMDEETSRRVFEPFFSTKNTVGTGLGLSTLYGTMESWGGRVEVASRLGQGTVFTLYLPVWTGVEERIEAGVVEKPTISSARLLVVDDEEIVRRALEGLWGEQHEVTLASDSLVALAMMGPDRYDVAIIDLGLPNIPGDQVALEMKKIDPQIVVIAYTGWFLEEDDPRLAAFDLYLAKPAQENELTAHLALAMELRHERTRLSQ